MSDSKYPTTSWGKRRVPLKPKGSFFNANAAWGLLRDVERWGLVELWDGKRYDVKQLEETYQANHITFSPFGYRSLNPPTECAIYG